MSLVLDKIDLRTTAPSILDQIGEWKATQAKTLQGLRPFSVSARNGDVLPAPGEDRDGEPLPNPAGDSVYFLDHPSAITLGNPVMRPGTYDGQRVRLSPTQAAVALPPGSARGAGATVLVAPGGDVTLLWDQTRGEWVLSGGAGTGGGGLTPVTRVAAVAIAAGDVVALDTVVGQVRPADATFASGLWQPAGIAAVGALAGAAVLVHEVHAQVVPARFAAAPPASSQRRPVFLDDTPGQVTLTPPDVSSAGRVRYLVGILQGTDGLSATPPILYQTQ